MKKSLFAKTGLLGLASLMLLLTPGCGVCGFAPGQVFFRDQQLELAVRRELAIPFSCITKADMLRLTDLNAAGFGIQFLDGIEEATNLVNLDLKSNSIQNINPLRDLDNLVDLDLSFNGIDTIEPLSGLDNLRVLDLTCNENIKNWDPLVALVTTNNGFLEGGTIYVPEDAVVLVCTDAEGEEFDCLSESYTLARSEILSYAQQNGVLIELIIGFPEGESCGF